jgi:hypothetical protein
MTTPLPGLHLVMMESQEVEAFRSSGQACDPGLVWVQLKTQRCQDLSRPAAGRFGLLSSAAKDDVVSGRGESHPPALSEPDVNVSAHPAPTVQPSGRTPTRQ